MQPNAYPSPEVRAMRRFVLFVLAFCAIVVLGALLPPSRLHDRGVVAAQVAGNWHTGDCDDNNNSHWGNAHVCQMRRTAFTLPSSHLSVDTTNGGIDVTGEDRSDVSLEAQVTAWAPSESEATSLLNQVVIDTAGGEVRDHGPHENFFGRRGYSVNYHLHVPRHLSGEFHSMNGGIELASLDGTIRFSTTNGGVGLSSLSGDVQGRTTNGGLNIALSGDHWQGEGLQADTTNGGVTLHIPDHYSAHLEASTVNGGISVDFPVTIQGEIKNHLDTTIGSGGATIHTQTTNGGVSISHSGSGATSDSGE
jgi:Putative adhesin